MTSQELELIEIAKEIIEKNNHLDAMLSGSLMLAYRGVSKRREATDIDILVEDVWGTLFIPDGFKEKEIETQEEYEESDYCRFFINKDGIKIDFFSTSEVPAIIDGVSCGSVKTMLDAKYEYWKDNGNEKHLLDLQFLNYEFPNALEELPY